MACCSPPWTGLWCLLPLWFAGCATGPAAPVAGPPATATARAQRRFVSPSSYAAFARAELLMVRQAFGEAVASYERALSGAGVDAYLLCRYARALHRAGDTEAALAVLAEAEQLEPGSHRPWLTRGQIAAQQGDRLAAMEAFERAEGLSPLDAEAPLAMAALLRAAGAPERALAVLQRLASRNPDFMAAASRARLHHALSRGDASAARHALSRLRAAAPATANELHDTARQLLDSGDPALAAALLAPRPATCERAPLRLRAFLEAEYTDQARDLLVRLPEPCFGDWVEVADALLQVDLPERALQAIATARLTRRHAPPAVHDRIALLEAQAQLALDAPAAAAMALAGIQPEAAAAPQARALLARALQRVALPQHARELERGAPRSVARQTDRAPGTTP